MCHHQCHRAADPVALVPLYSYLLSLVTSSFRGGFNSKAVSDMRPQLHHCPLPMGVPGGSGSGLALCHTWNCCPSKLQAFLLSLDAHEDLLSGSLPSLLQRGFRWGP